MFSIYLIDAFYDEDDAQSLAYDAAFGFLGEARARLEEDGEIAWWDTHGADEQRYYNTVCLFYGAAPEERLELANELGLPRDRADYCPQEFDQANVAWGGVLDNLIERGPGDTLVFDPPDDSITSWIFGRPKSTH